MMSRKSSAVVGAAFLTVALAVPTMAQEPTVEVLADGLNNPRGVKVADDGSVYVAEAGFGGDTCLGEGAEAMCYGPTGAVVRVTPDGVERVVEGLNSGASGLKLAALPTPPSRRMGRSTWSSTLAPTRLPGPTCPRPSPTPAG